MKSLIVFLLKTNFDLPYKHMQRILPYKENKGLLYVKTVVFALTTTICSVFLEFLTQNVRFLSLLNLLSVSLTTLIRKNPNQRTIDLSKAALKYHTEPQKNSQWDHESVRIFSKPAPSYCKFTPNE